MMPNGLRCYGPHMMRPWLAWPKRRSAACPGHRADVDDRRDIGPGGAVCGHGVRYHELRATVGQPEAGQRRAGLPGEGGQLIQDLQLAGPGAVRESSTPQSSQSRARRALSRSVALLIHGQVQREDAAQDQHVVLTGGDVDRIAVGQAEPAF